MAKLRLIETLLAGCFALLLATIYLGSPRSTVGAQSPQTRTNWEELQQTGERLCQLVAPEAGPLRVTLERSAPDAAGPPSAWLVGTDASGRDVVCIDWDVRTGQLVSVSHLAPPAGMDAEPLDEKEAVAAARRWMDETGVAGYGREWRLKAAPKHTEFAWAMQWQAADHDVYVSIEHRTGALVQLVHRSGSATRMPVAAVT